MDCARDGVHEPFNKDIQEGPFGAVSLCTSHLNTFNDVDLGDYLTLTAKEYTCEKPSVHPLLENYQNQLPLRLVRSYNLTNDYAPKTGYRYDGLYTVAACWVGVNSEAEKYYKFALARLPFQDPPQWKLSRKSRTRTNDSKICSANKLTQDHLSDSQNNTNDEESLRSLRRRSLMAKRSLQKSNIAKRESTIVERCISKKPDGQSPGGMLSIPYTESVGSNNRLFDSSSSPLAKFQNTNISIRTELYDSSNIIHQEARKSIPMTTFCRTYKNSRLPSRPINHSNVVSLNLNSCGPCPKDNAQESLIQSRSGIPKFSNDRSTASDPAVDRSTPKVLSTELKTKCDDDAAQTATESDGKFDKIVESSDTLRGNDGLEREESGGENLMKTVADVDGKMPNDFSDENRENVEIPVPNGTNSLENWDISSELKEKSIEEENAKEIQSDLHSLTPDQMLNFIVNQKYHPRAKLLIGSVIGLATGESTILRAYEALMSRKNRWTRETSPRSEKNEILQEKEEKLSMVDSRDYESMKKKSTNVERSEDLKGSKSHASKGVLRENKDRLMKKMTLRRTRVSKRLVGSEKKSNSKNLRAKTSKRLIKSSRSDVKSQKLFSKSTILKESGKGVKKRRGELANLVIDANIGPLIRGPRNRRLRCKTHIFAKNMHGKGEVVPSCCAKKVGDVTRRGKKDFGRVELSMRKPNVSRIKAKMAESPYGGRNDYSGGSRVRRSFPDELLMKTSEDRTARGEKRKLPRPRSSSRDAAKSNGFVKRRCRNLCDKNVGTTRIKTMDAATQCSASCRDMTTSIDPEIIENPLNPIKIEWIDVDDVKSEIFLEEDDDDGSSEESVNETNVENLEGSVSSSNVNPAPLTSSPALSAFIPVNISAGDFRIARLRSIGFKPIRPDGIFDDGISQSDKYIGDCASTNSENLLETPTIGSRQVDELFNKYTSEETTSVGYMDHELRYQDIENEEKIYSRRKPKIYGTAKRGRRITRMGTNKIAKTPRDENISTNEEDSDAPWHGWKATC